MKAVDTAYGKFEDVYYDELTNAKDEEIGCEMYLRFTPAIRGCHQDWLDPDRQVDQGRKIQHGPMRSSRNSR